MTTYLHAEIPTRTGIKASRDECLDAIEASDHLGKESRLSIFSS